MLWFKNLYPFVFQKIKQSTERQRELENEHVKAISRLNNSGTQNFIEDVPTLQVDGFI